MRKGTKRLPTIVPEDLLEVMEEVTKEAKPLFGRVGTNGEQQALNIFFGTLSSLMRNIFDYLPPEQQDEILVNCGTWFDIGMLFGKSPKLLLEILDRVNPKIVPIEVPSWFADGFTTASKQEEV